MLRNIATHFRTQGGPHFWTQRFPPNSCPLCSASCSMKPSIFKVFSLPNRLWTTTHKSHHRRILHLLNISPQVIFVNFGGSLSPPSRARSETPISVALFRHLRKLKPPRRWSFATGRCSQKDLIQQDSACFDRKTVIVLKGQVYTKLPSAAGHQNPKDGSHKKTRRDQDKQRTNKKTKRPHSKTTEHAEQRKPSFRRNPQIN